MGWLFELHKTQPIAHAVGVLAFVCVVGMALGSVKVKGVGLGTAGVLFAGILVGHFGIALFFAAVGLSAGAKFFATVFSTTGLQWLLAGVCVTVLCRSSSSASSHA
jgi:putative transport protein